MYLNEREDGKLKKPLLFCLALITSLSIFFPQQGFASENTSQVITEYQMLDEILPEMQGTIIKEIPNFTINKDVEKVSLIYKQKNTTNNSDSEHSQNKPLTQIAKPSTALPKANEQPTNLFATGLGVILIILILAFFIWKRKHLKQFLVIGMLLGGLGISKITLATNDALPIDVTETLDRGTVYTKSTTVPGFEYIGYIHASENIPPVVAQPVIVHYQDQNGQKIAENTIINGNIGDSYKTEQIDIDGYTFNSVTGDTSGILSDVQKSVIYTYEKIPVIAQPVTVHYQDLNGQKIAEDTIIKGNIGDPYTTEQINIDGYTFNSVTGDTSGILSDIQKSVIYTYEKEKNEAKLIIRFNNSSLIIPDFKTMDNGIYNIPENEDIENLEMRLEYNNQVYHQNEKVTDIIIPATLGETYSLPKYMTLKFYNAQGIKVDYLKSTTDVFFSGYSSKGYDTNNTGTIDEKEVIVNYTLEPTIIIF
ncbi:hypothetical protein I580_00531 [Enterococcus caccae ATCC BAA-1240]|uniref:MucBP domain-containing protein n=1 Tax=Enterococcus caccae ATCC BAA-1240 TaxID=1158612 RepID=R3W7H2_9ENTE|nr:hypothetical protein UC7_02781 [Enterococcus caccae ATCC BAA-1240]EOT68148.1 hypothetical protein I580_00531 [Enterococcus caccae ATCC BAA-1240]OJG26988.1 hypothetical protein RU98_GL003079 [Enterococcus caccae]